MYVIGFVAGAFVLACGFYAGWYFRDIAGTVRGETGLQARRKGGKRKTLDSYSYPEE